MGECCGFPRVPASRCARARETTMSRCPARSASPSSAVPAMTCYSAATVRTGSRAGPVTTIWMVAAGTTSCPADRTMTSGTAGTKPTGSTAATGATIPRAAAGWMSSTADRATTSSPAAPAMTSCAAAPATTGSTPASAMTSSTAPAGSDTAHLTRGDRHTNVEAVRTVQVTELDSPIRVEGTAAFVERVRADLRLLQASPIGQRMLAELDRGDTIVIVEDESTSASWTALDLPGGRRFTVFTVAYNTMRGVSADRSSPMCTTSSTRPAHPGCIRTRTTRTGSPARTVRPPERPTTSGPPLACRSTTMAIRPRLTGSTRTTRTSSPRTRSAMRWPYRHAVATADERAFPPPSWRTPTTRPRVSVLEEGQPLAEVSRSGTQDGRLQCDVRQGRVFPRCEPFDERAANIRVVRVRLAVVVPPVGVGLPSEDLTEIPHRAFDEILVFWSVEVFQGLQVVQHLRLQQVQRRSREVPAAGAMGVVGYPLWKRLLAFGQPPIQEV